MLKERKSKTRPGEKLIDGLPVLRGMFVCPESLQENNSQVPDRVLTGHPVFEKDHSFLEEKSWGSNWSGQD